MACNWTLTWDNKAAFIPISKNCRNILIILVTGSTEPAYIETHYQQRSTVTIWDSDKKMEKSNYVWKMLITTQDMIFYLFENNTLQWLQKRINQLAILTTVNLKINKIKSLENYSIKILLLLISPYRCHNIVNFNWTFQHGNILPPSYYECHTRFFHTN